MMYKTVLEDSDGQLYLQFCDCEMNQIGWDIGDEIVWEQENDTSFRISKKD